MRIIFIFLFTILSSLIILRAQSTINHSGVYALTGVMEIASAFRLNTDSTFEFYYSYGALDRYGSGKWRMQDGSIILNSKTSFTKDFKITDSAVHKGNYTTIKIEDQNTAFYSFVYCVDRGVHGDTLLPANESGVIELPRKTNTICLLSTLSPERRSSFAVDSTRFNSYTFHFESWALEVFFREFKLRPAGDGLEGKHPLLDGLTYTYSRER